MKTKILTAAFTLTVFASDSLFGSERKFEKSFPGSPGGTLVLITDIGDATIQGGGGDEVRISAAMRGNANDVEDFIIDAKQSGNTVEVSGKMKEKKIWSLGIDDLEVRYTIIVPAQTNIRVGTSGGDVGVDRVTGDITLETSGGDIRSTRTEGKLTLGTSGGDILLSEVSGNVMAETSGGDIQVTGAKGAVVLETSGGDIRVSSSDGSVRAKTSGGDIVVMLTGSNNGVDVQTSGGDIDIMAGGEIRANLDASTSGGSIICSLPVTMQGEIDESHVMGTLNGGGELIRARTSGGDITIKGAK